MSKQGDALEALEGMVQYFGCRTKREGRLCLWTGGLWELEEAFEALGWDDPHPFPDYECDHPGCSNEATCGKPTSDGYMRVCEHHFSALSEGDEM